MVQQTEVRRTIVQRRSLRFGLLAGGGLALVFGLWTGLSRAGIHRPIAMMGDHGILMVLGFLGTLIALERAVASGAAWTYGGPALGVVATLMMVFSGPQVLAGGALAGGGAILTVATAQMDRQQPQLHLKVMAAGAAMWVLAASLWMVGWAPTRVVPMLAAFLVLTIVGERLELSRLRRFGSGTPWRFVAAVVVFAGGVLLSLLDWNLGLVVAGTGLVAMSSWLWRNDLARATIHMSGIARFAAACMLAGYFWMAVSGVLWVVLGLGMGPALIWDAALHSLFLGFAISMVMGHAPIILPAVLGTSLRHRPISWLPLGLLHVSVGARVAADLAGWSVLREVGLHGNVTAIVLFILFTIWGART